MVPGNAKSRFLPRHGEVSGRVSINGRFLTRVVHTGVDRFGIELLRDWLPRYGAARDARIIAPAGSAASLTGFQAPATCGGRFSGHLWEQLELPGLSGSDLLINLCNTAPALLQRQLVVLHDANVVANPWVYSAAFRTWYRCLFACLMRRAVVVATVSKFSASELMKHVGGRSQGIEIIYESGEHVLRVAPQPDVLRRLGIADKRYVLAVGSRSPNKNFAGVVGAASMLQCLDVKIVLAGGSDKRIFAGAPLDLENVVLAGYVTDGELRALYQSAECFLYPSFYEGFGLPPLEAMHCGCPVIVSRRASLPEVCGTAARYCDPDDHSDIARQIAAVLASAGLRQELAQAGLQQAAKFTWRDASNQLEDIFARTLI